jgi:hypothetical protein
MTRFVVTNIKRGHLSQSLKGERPTENLMIESCARTNTCVCQVLVDPTV